MKRKDDGAAMNGLGTVEFGISLKKIAIIPDDVPFLLCGS
jgi:hypothetical protein